MFRLFWVTFLMTSAVNSLEVQSVFRTLFFSMLSVLTYSMPTPVCELSTFVKCTELPFILTFLLGSIMHQCIFTIFYGIRWFVLCHLHGIFTILFRLIQKFMVHVCFFQTMVCGSNFDYTTHVCVILAWDILKQLVLIAFWTFNIILPYFNGTE